MMKKILSTVFAAVLVVCMTVSPALAEGFNDISTTYARDHYQLLSSSELKEFENTAKQLSDEYNCNVYLTIVDNIGNYSVHNYAEAYWNHYDLGRGNNKNGVMLLLAVDSRKIEIITHGQDSNGGITIFTDFRLNQMLDNLVNELSGNNWAQGCRVYLNDVADTFAFYYEKGAAWDNNNDPATLEEEKATALAISAILPFILAAILCIIWAKQMKTAHMKYEANDYLEEGSLVLTHQSDRYITTTRTRVMVESDSKGGGGSSISSGGFGGTGGRSF